MILGRTPAGAIKTKTDGGLRAVNCACCVSVCVQYDESPSWVWQEIPANIASALLSSNIYADLSASSPTASVSFQNVLFSGPSQPSPGICEYMFTLSIGEEESGAFISTIYLIKALGKWYISGSANVFLDPFAGIYTYDAGCPVSPAGSFTLLGIPLTNAICAFNEDDISSFTVDIHE